MILGQWRHFCLYILNKVGIWRDVTDAWLTTLKDSATQLLIKYKSGALVTQILLSLYFAFLLPVWKVCQEKFDEEQNNIPYESHEVIIREWKHLILELNKRKFDDNEEVPKTDFSFSTLGSKLPNFDVVWVKKWEKKYQLGFLASLFVKAVTDVKEGETYFAKLGDFLLKTALISFSASSSMRGVRKNEEKEGDEISSKLRDVAVCC